MPAFPEFGYGSGEIRALEVVHEVESHHLGGTDCDIGVSGEVAVDLEGEEDGC